MSRLLDPRGRRTGGGPRRAIRNAEIGELQDTFLICAVATILVIRLQLWLTNYPQLAPGKLHIAHLLWGGLLMLIALGILLSYIGRAVRTPAAVIGGIGFGFFIDELGKFITADNDYFFNPTAALIYVVFIVLFLVSRAMRRRRGFSEREYLVNAIEMLAEAARHDLDERERRRALELLERADPSDPLVPRVRSLLEESAVVPEAGPSFLARAAGSARDRYLRLIERPRAWKVLAAIFLLWAAASLVQILALVLSLGFALEGNTPATVIERLADRGEDLSFIGIASIASSVVAGGLVIAGVYLLRRRSRLDAYRMFDRAILVQIFVTQVFAFVESEFAAVFGLSLDLLLLVTLRYMMRRELELARVTPGTASASAGLPDAPDALANAARQREGGLTSSGA